MAELFAVLADQLHETVPFDYLALLLHDEPASEMPLVVLEPPDIMPPFTSVPVAEQGPAAAVWETQQGTVMTIPPLRERVDDIPALARHFAQQSSRRMGRAVPSIPEKVMDALKRWSWPGNIRELQNVIERAVILSGPMPVLPPQDIQPVARRAASRAKPAGTFNEAEREAILNALRDSGGVIGGPSGAAKRLGLNRTTLHSKMQRLGIQRPSY